MSCPFREQLDRYADGELPEADVTKVESHLRECTSCASQALQRIQLKRSIHVAAATNFAPSAEFRARVAKSVSASPPRRWSWQPVLAFATVAIVLLGAAIWARQSSGSEVLSEVVDLHVTTIASANPVDVISSDRHTVKPWFEGKLPFTFNLPELQNSDFRLIGGRMAYLGQKPAAQLLFAVRKHQISVFILQDSKSVPEPADTQKSGFTVDSWADHGLRYIAISDSSPGDVESLSKLLRSAEH